MLKELNFLQSHRLKVQTERRAMVKKGKRKERDPRKAEKEKG